MKKSFLTCAFTTLALILSLAACGTADPGKSSSDTDNAAIPTGEFYNTAFAVFDGSNKKLGTVNSGGAMTLTDSGILYTAWPENADGSVTEYRVFDPKTGTDTLVGTVEGQSYEAAFMRVESGGKLYTLVTRGNLFDDIKDTLLLLEIDPAAGQITEHIISENGFPYAGIAEFNGKLVIFCHDQQDTLHDRVFEFDPAADGEKVKQIFEFGLSKDVTGDTLRQVCADSDRLYLLRLNLGEDGTTGAFIDEYDTNYTLIRQRDVTGLLLTAAVDTLGDENDAQNELKQHASRFAVIDGRYLYYENFSSTRCLADLETGKALTETNGLFAGSGGSGRIFFCLTFGGTLDGSGINNAVYELSGGSLTESAFYAPEKDYYITYTARAQNGAKMIVMERPQSEQRQPIIFCSLG